MFDRPKTNSFVAPAEPIDPNQRYLVKVVELVDLGPSKYPNPGDDPDNPTHRIQWKFQLATQTGEKILDMDGQPYIHFDYTSSKTGKSTRAGGKTATARMWMEALFGKSLEDDEIGADIADQLRGKTAVALFEEKDSGGQDGQESYIRLRILRLTPRKPGSPVQTASTEVKAASEKAQATVARSRTAVAEPPANDDVAF